jgi:hypothetical protein
MSVLKIIIFRGILQDQKRKLMIPNQNIPPLKICCQLHLCHVKKKYLLLNIRFSHGQEI